MMIARIITKPFIMALLIFLFCCRALLAQESVEPLTLHKAYFIKGLDNAQLSGLTVYDGSLYTVSDKHDAWIYRIDFKNDAAVLRKYRQTGISAFSILNRHDFEGITHDASGNFYLISETECRIRIVPPQGHKSEWIGPVLKSRGEQAGLFQVPNAYLEGICCIAPQKFILCAERQPRGFMEVDLSREPAGINAYASNQSKYCLEEGRSVDFSGLFKWADTIYVLERNAYVVSRLEKKHGRFAESRGWSYRHIETNKEFRYSDMRYGKAEGLCVDEAHVYIILDNNDVPLAADPSRRQPLLLIFEKPDNF